jgi:rare lipoprotein A (peptidoglycan hydrolase)
MKLTRYYPALSLVAVAVMAAGLTAVEFKPAREKQVQVEYNGLRWTQSTLAIDVSEFLLTTFGDYTDLQVSPPPETKLLGQSSIHIIDPAASALHQSVSANLAVATAPPPTPVPATSQPKIYTGLATWYSFGDQLTTASRQFPKGTRLKVVAVNSGKSVEVVVNDYGPQAWTGIALDLNRPAFAALAPLGAGKIQIKYYKL